MSPVLVAALRREIGISQKLTWFILHRLRTDADASKELFSGSFEADETYIYG